jgi:hypothetical protein
LHAKFLETSEVAESCIINKQGDADRRLCEEIHGQVIHSK